MVYLVPFTLSRSEFKKDKKFPIEIAVLLSYSLLLGLNEPLYVET